MSTHIAISGLIGAGKTTLAVILGELLDLDVYYEPVIDNKRLDDFYKDIGSNAFSYEIYLLTQRFKQHQQLVWSDKGGIQDRSIYEDVVFVKMLKESGKIRESDYEVYMDLYNSLMRLMCNPTLIIHLDVSPEESLRRIKERGRECEKNITLEYLTSLIRYYNEFILDISKSIRVIVVKYESYSDPHEIALRVKEELSNIQFISRI